MVIPNIFRIESIPMNTSKIGCPVWSVLFTYLEFHFWSRSFLFIRTWYTAMPKMGQKIPPLSQYRIEFQRKWMSKVFRKRRGIFYTGWIIHALGFQSVFLGKTTIVTAKFVQSETLYRDKRFPFHESRTELISIEKSCFGNGVEFEH